MRQRMLTIVLAAAIPILAATSPEAGAAAAYHDAAALPHEDRPFVRYLWWGTDWDRYELLTRSTQAIISQAGSFPRPVKVCPGLMRIDLRESGHEKFLHVWERFRGIDFVYHAKKKYFQDATYLTYYPAGLYTTNVNKDGKETVQKDWYAASAVEKKIKAGEINDESAPWADSLVEAKSGVKTSALDELRRLLNTEVPILWGPFWMVRVQRQIDITNKVLGVGYYEWFGLKNRNDFFKLLVLDEGEAKKRRIYWGAYVKKSGVSQQERLIVILGAAAGKAYGTLDVFTQKEDVADKNQRGQPALNLRDGELTHDAEEWIGVKADGLWLNALFAAKDDPNGKFKAGDAQETAPDKIGTDTSTTNLSLDKRIGPDNCIHCHGAVGRDFIIQPDDWLRKNVVRGRAVLRDKDRNVELELDSKYLRSIDLVMKQSREAFADAVSRLTRDENDPKDKGMSIAQFLTFYRGAYYAYVEPKNGVTPDLAARWLGVKKESLVGGMKRLNAERGQIDFIVANYAFDPPEGVNTLAFEDRYAFLQIVSRGIVMPELYVRVKGFDSSVKGKAP